MDCARRRRAPRDEFVEPEHLESGPPAAERAELPPGPAPPAENLAPPAAATVQPAPAALDAPAAALDAPAAATAPAALDVPATAEDHLFCLLSHYLFVILLASLTFFWLTSRKI